MAVPTIAGQVIARIGVVFVIKMQPAEHAKECPLMLRRWTSTRLIAHVPQLDVRILEDLLHAIAVAGVFRDQLPTPAGQTPQLADRERWDGAWLDHAVAEKMRQPAAVIRIGLVPALVLHVGSVGKDDRDLRLKQVEDRPTSMPAHRSIIV
jgi:hypothetical protein